jgi:hypothetical protein
MIARGFKPVVWVAAVGAAALGCYMLSLRVASERADLTRLQSRIVATQQQIRALQTDVGTRARLAQLEQWNDEVLALAPPASGQFVQGAQLARFETHDGSPLDGQAVVQTASVDPAPAPLPPPAAAAMPAPQHAVAAAPAIAAPAPFRQATVQRTSLTLPAQPAPAPAPARLQPAPPPTRAATSLRAPAAPVRVASATPRAAVQAPRAAAPAPGRTAIATAPVRTRTASAAPMPRGSAPAHRSTLLDDRTLRALGSAARAERGGGTRD